MKTFLITLGSRRNQSGAKATAVQTLRDFFVVEPREAFGLRRVHRRFGCGVTRSKGIEQMNSFITAGIF